MNTLADLDEAAVIALFADAGAPPFPEVVVPNGDDAAVWRARAGRAEVATTDALVEGVHFLRARTTPEQLGWKLMAVNLSDLAAMGAEPRYALIAVCLPPDLPVAFARGVGAGIRAAAAAHGVYVIGGNVARSPGPVMLTATLVGDVDPARVLRRAGARVGDRLLVSGVLGRACVALEAGARGVEVGEAVTSALHAPVPQIALGRALAATGVVRAMCDVSDGLARDVARMLAPLGARIEVARLPVEAEATRVGWDPIDAAVAGGEDYGLLLAVAPEDVGRVLSVSDALSDVGVVTSGGGVVRSDGRAVTGGFAHFAP